MSNAARLVFLPSAGRYCVAGVECTLEPKCAHLLQVLGEHCDEVVSSEELRSQVWAGRLIGPGVIPQTILKLRKALNDDGSMIRSVRNQGYMLTVPIVEIAEVAEPVEIPIPDVIPESIELPASKLMPVVKTPSKHVHRPSARVMTMYFALLGFLAIATAGLALMLPSTAVPPFELPSRATTPIANPAAVHTLARHFSVALTPSALREADRLLLELAAVPEWRALAQADLARVVVLRHQYDNQPYATSRTRAEAALATAVQLAPDAAATLYASAVLAGLQADFPVALARFARASEVAADIPSFAADYAAIALPTGDLRLTDELVRNGLVVAPEDARLLLQKAWLTHLGSAPTGAWSASPWIEQARQRAPGLLALEWVAVLQRLQRREWSLAYQQMQALQPANAHDSEGLALAIVIAVQQSDRRLASSLLNLYALAESGGRGRNLCLIWEALAQSGNRGINASLSSLIEQVPEALPEGLWLRAYVAGSAGNPAAALTLARRAYQLSLQRGVLVDLTLPDFAMHRLGFYANLLQTQGDTLGMNDLRNTLAAQQQRLRAAGLHAELADRLSLDAP